MIVRELTSEDLVTYQDPIIELLVDTYMLNFNLSLEECKSLCQDKMNTMQKYVTKGNAIVYGVIHTNQLIGFQWLYKHTMFGEERLHVNQLAVNENYRRLGIGKQLILKTKEKARELGIDTIDLLVSESNQAALSLYTQNGFVTERRLMHLKL